jgi:glycosyltransferase involved in cell wall biosynthesis
LPPPVEAHTVADWTAARGAERRVLKVLFINNGLTHYYNLVLNKLSELTDIELLVVTPKSRGRSVGEGVYQTKENARFRILELEEYRRFALYTSFHGLSKALWQERPGVVIVSDSYLFAFLFSLPVILTMKLLRIRFVLKSIPFRLPTYEDQVRDVHERKGFVRFGGKINWVLMKLGIAASFRRLRLAVRKTAFNRPDAHVNYVDEAFSVYGSYGVPRERIFITANSPDTDYLLEVRKSLAAAQPPIDKSEHRIIHVGRLVEWKRVDLLVRAFAKIKKRFRDAELMVIGDGPEKEKLQDLARNLGIAEAVGFPGGVYEAEYLGRFLMSSAVYVLAGMGGLSINEAMCFGLPVVCSVCDGTEKKLVRDGFNGRVFREGDVDDLYSKIEPLLDNPQLAEEMGLRSLQIIRNEVNIDTVIKGYKNALDFACRGRRC